MTLPEERLRALREVREVLLNYAMLPGPIRKGEFRRSVRAALKHYPGDFDLQRMAAKCKGLLR